MLIGQFEAIELVSLAFALVSFIFVYRGKLKFEIRKLDLKKLK